MCIGGEGTDYPTLHELRQLNFFADFLCETQDYVGFGRLDMQSMAE